MNRIDRKYETRELFWIKNNKPLLRKHYAINIDKYTLPTCLIDNGYEMFYDTYNFVVSKS